MHICSCRPSDKPLTSGGVVEQVAQGASSVKEVVERTGAGTNCGGCAPTLAKVKGAVREIAAERDAAVGRAGAAWPTTDELVRADRKVSSAIFA